MWMRRLLNVIALSSALCKVHLNMFKGKCIFLCRRRRGTNTKSIFKIAKCPMRPQAVAFSHFLHVCSAQRAAHICYALVLTLMIRFGSEHVKIFSHSVFHMFCVGVAIRRSSMFCLMQSIVWKIF